MSDAFLRSPLFLGVLADAYRETVPLFVLAELTDACNERCRHCYVDASGTETMSRREWAKLWDQLAGLGALVLTLSGGEPLLHPEFAGIYADAHDRRFAIRLFSNGLLVGDAVLRLLEARKPLAVEVSLYGPSAMVHDAITGIPGSFERTTAAVRSLVSLGLAVAVKTVWMRANASCLDEMAALAGSLGAEFRGTTNLTAARSGKPEVLDQRLDLAELLNIMKSAKGISAAERGRPDDAGPRAASKEGFPCGAGRITMRISAAGRVFPCVEFETEAGDARRMSLQEIWRSSPALAALRGLRNGDAAECVRCDLAADCFRCPAQALKEGGDMRGCYPEALRQARVRKLIREERDERSL